MGAMQTAGMPAGLPAWAHPAHHGRPRRGCPDGVTSFLLDDVPSDTGRALTGHTLAFLALSDMAYGYDHISNARRRDVSPCLAAWGARGPVRFVTAAGGDPADRTAFLFATRKDVIVSIRGMDGLGSLGHYQDVTPVYDAAYFGAQPPRRPPPPPLPLQEYRTKRPFSDPDLYWVLRRDYNDTRQMEGPLVQAVAELVEMMEPASRRDHRVWLTGHSSGGAIAQLMALRLAVGIGARRIGGVLLFNSDRVGSAAFAAHYNSLLGNKTVRFGYGRDNANLASNMAMGMRFPGRAFWACPVPGRPVEALVSLPVGEDRVNMCRHYTPFPRGDDAETKDDTTKRWHVPFFPRGYPVMSTIAEWDSFSHHFTPLLFDALERAMGGAAGPCVEPHLRLPQCQVSDHCATALRLPGGPRCRSCSDDTTCSDYWALGPGYKCDNWPSIWRSNLCHRRLPFGINPTLLGLFFTKSSSSSAPSQQPPQPQPQPPPQDPATGGEPPAAHQADPPGGGAGAGAPGPS